MTQNNLSNLEHSISAYKDNGLPLLQCDKWLGSSTWQKSMRRGQIDLAVQAATTFWSIDRTAFWRRCLLVVVEDIGVGDIDTVIQVLNICASAQLRRKVGDLKSALYVTEIMCKAVKCRLADHLYISTQSPHAQSAFKLPIEKMPDTLLSVMANDKAITLHQRALALWLLAGTNKFPSDVLPQRIGTIENAAHVLRAICKNANLLDACIPVLTRTPYPLTLFMPLMASAISNGVIKANQLASEFSITGGLPHYAADTFTRVGKACIRGWQKAVPDLKRFSTAQIGLGVFYTEGAIVDKELTNNELVDYKQSAEFYDVEAAGLCIPEYLGLREIINQSWPILEEIRQKRLTGYLREQSEWGGQFI